MTWIDIVVAVLITLAANAPVLFLYICTAFYFYLLNGYTFRQDFPKVIKWTEYLSHVPDKLSMKQISCKKGCCEYLVREYSSEKQTHENAKI